MTGLHALAYFDLTDCGPDEIADIHAVIEADEVEVQVQLARNGPWHRQTTSPYKPTACGLVVQRPAAMGPVGWLNVRNHDYTGKLCPVCFTSFELDLSEKANRREDDDA